MGVSGLIEINGIDAADADEAWLVVGPLISEALVNGRSHMVAETLLVGVKAGLDQLWAVRIDGEFVATFVTQIDDYDTGRVLGVVAIAGERMDEWLPSVDQLVHEFAAHHGCKFITSEGRPGWERALAPLGWLKASTRMLKEV
jgi:hypothetical protein